MELTIEKMVCMGARFARLGNRFDRQQPCLIAVIAAAVGLGLASQASASSSKTLGQSCQPYGPAPAISANGRFAVMLRATISGECSELVLYDITNDTERILTSIHPKPNDNFGPLNLAVSDDGLTVALDQPVGWDLRTGRGRAGLLGRTGKWIVSTDTSSIREMPAPKGSTAGWFPLSRGGLSANGALLINSVETRTRRMPYVWTPANNRIRFLPRYGLFGKRRVLVATTVGYMHATSVSPSGEWVAGSYDPSLTSPRKGKNYGEWCHGVYLWNTRTNVLRVLRLPVAHWRGAPVCSVRNVADDGTTFTFRSDKKGTEQAMGANGKSLRVLGKAYMLDNTPPLPVGVSTIFVRKGTQFAEWNWRTGAITPVAPVDATLPMAERVSASADLSTIGYVERTFNGPPRLVVMTR